MNCCACNESEEYLRPCVEPAVPDRAATVLRGPAGWCQPRWWGRT